MSQLANAQAEYEKFPEEFTSIIISTVNKQGIPNASYAPFVMDDDKNIYIYVSGLATHTQNIQNHPFVSVLFIDDEIKTKQIFARRRLNFDCTANLLERETEQWQEIVDKFQVRFGELISTLRSLPDFRILQLTPNSGRFVIGFGAAYNISHDNINQLVQITKDSLS
ncbi:pyridoxamine 5'-phosphate oxidase family protein [Dolichospermum sp. LEGE 00240]|jgi:heme iron utilization protein|uniref:HugZ family pyridoxamine 5'-phosphate oxidase n=1 Tax=Dolichospermum sp. LEGE 00240 TaxID=1828603 RepID=UPI0018813454|nr:pyridoxamine 5'-phosphate oxidase family protein [Dolichospermum sp. LEGE 00240]MBE9247869.1 pyridoxamine 5'-phosphate oxidase family protein [Dolichospermum sp. LEGE 00240]MDM3844866.1 pyridoxamine 5'-phosphate oxidase family protein [Aphanizomenon gracile PMC638.10]MDM3850157.1 pyridoxamine 5'-phosphate oxidase family protein [Aphanizomenon gracile PMC627.10]MDM3862645.1 pyridoxamine 5'-phosphate oxidase family protein [Aphanizomenon gracile PMC644.10]